MVSEFPYYDEEDPDLRELVRQVDELILDKEERRCHFCEILIRGIGLEEIMLRHQERLVAEHKVMFWLKIGQLYSMTRQNKLPAIDALFKVVILDPRVTEAWDTLADVYWDVKDYENAEFCLTKSLRLARRKVPLRNMAVIYRKLINKHPYRKFRYLQMGLNLAKEAVDLDITDGVSWGILGNAYLSTHLKIKKDIISAKLALSAYKQAIRMGNTSNPELFYYLGYANTYCEQYEDALASLDKSILLDKDEDKLIKFRDAILSFLDKIQNLCSTFGKLTPKRLAKFRKGLQGIDLVPIVISLNAAPACEGSLHLGKNPGRFVMGKVVWCVPAEDCLPLACGCIEPNGQVFVTTVYNMVPENNFFVGNIIFVTNPDYKLVKFKYNDQLYEFKSLRVDNPTTLLVNQERLTDNFFVQE